MVLANACSQHEVLCNSLRAVAMNFHFRYLVFVPLAVVVLLAAPVAGNAAEPDSGTVSADSPAVAWSGGPFLTSNPTVCLPEDPACDRFALTIEPSGEPGDSVEVTTAADEGDDYDLFVFAPDGSLAGSSATASGNESVTLFEPVAGIYTVEVQAWLVTPGSTYVGGAMFTVGSAGGGGGGPPLKTSGAFHATPVGPDFEGTPANRKTGFKGGVRPPKVAIFPIGREAAEPTVGVNQDGTGFYAAGTFDAIAGGLARTEVMRSRDGGRTWVSVQPELPGGITTEPPLTLDPMVYVEEDTGRMFNIELYVGCAYLLFSDDEGESWTRNPIACGDPVNDHHTIVAGPPPAGLTTIGFPEVVYYCFNRVADSSCGRSFDGGTTFSPSGTPAFPGVDSETGGFCGGLHGHIVTDSAGRVFLPKGHCSVATVAISEDGATTWENVKIDTNLLTADHEVTLAVDAADNLYAVWWDNADRLPYLAISRDHGTNWSTPLMIAPPGVHEVNFPTIAAGDEGRIAIHFPGTMVDNRGDASRPWNLYEVMSVDALAEEPLFVWATANDPADPIHRGDCGPGRCAGMFDFLDIVVAPAGVPAESSGFWAAATDTCIGDCVTDDGPADAMEGIVVRQLGGPALRVD